LLCFDASTTEASNFGVAEKTTTHKMVEGVRGDAAVVLVRALENLAKGRKEARWAI
jgi:hypothetical protein